MLTDLRIIAAAIRLWWAERRLDIEPTVPNLMSVNKAAIRLSTLEKQRATRR